MPGNGEQLKQQNTQEQGANDLENKLNQLNSVDSKTVADNLANSDVKLPPTDKKEVVNEKTQTEKNKEAKEAYNTKVFEIGKSYKQNMDAIKKDPTKAEELNNKMKQNINDYRTAYTTYEKSINNDAAINENMSTQDKEAQLIQAYKTNSDYKKLVEKTTQTITTLDKPGTTITKEVAYPEGIYTGLDLGKTNFSEENINTINKLLDENRADKDTKIRITGLTDATKFTTAESKQNNINLYTSIREKFITYNPDLKSGLPTVEDIKKDPNISDVNNQILGYRRILVAMDNALKEGKIKQEDISKLSFASEVGEKEKDDTHRGIKLEVVKKIVKETKPTYKETTIPSPEILRQSHDYVRAFALNPNYGKDKIDPRYPKPEYNRPYMFVQLSLGAAANSKEGPTWKVADINEINVFDSLDKPLIDVNNTESKDINKNVQPIYTFVSPDNVQNIIDKNFIGSKDYTASTNQLLMPVIMNNRENTKNALEEQKKSVEIIRYIAAKKDKQENNGLLVDTKAYDAISRALDYNIYRKENNIDTKDSDAVKDVKKKKVNDDFKYISDSAYQGNIPLKSQGNENRNQSQDRDTNKKVAAITWLAGQTFEANQIIKVNGNYMKPKFIGTDSNKKTVGGTEMKTDENLIGYVKKYDKLDKDFIKALA